MICYMILCVMYIWLCEIICYDTVSVLCADYYFINGLEPPPEFDHLGLQVLNNRLSYQNRRLVGRLPGFIRDGDRGSIYRYTWYHMIFFLSGFLPVCPKAAYINVIHIIHIIYIYIYIHTLYTFHVYIYIYICICQCLTLFQIIPIHNYICKCISIWIYIYIYIYLDIDMWSYFQKIVYNKLCTQSWNLKLIRCLLVVSHYTALYFCLYAPMHMHIYVCIYVLIIHYV